MKICFVSRKPQAGYFSIEKIFLQVRRSLERRFTIDQVMVPHSRLTPLNVMRNFKAIRKVKSDLYHVTGDIHYLALGTPGRKTVLTIHDCVFLHQTTGLKRWVLRLFFIKWPVRHCRAVTTISEKSKHEIIQHSGCSPHKIVVVPNPVGEQFYYSSYDFREAEPHILFVGTAPHKNLERVIAALSGIPCKLVIVGRLQEKYIQLLNEHRVTYELLSDLTEQELADTYAGVDMILFPSLYEGFGLPIIEGQKSGRPVITSNISPMKDVAGRGACLVDPFRVESIREGIRKVINEPLYRKSLIENGSINVKQYEVNAISERYLSVYQSVR